MDDLDDLIAISTERDPSFPRRLADARARWQGRHVARAVLDRVHGDSSYGSMQADAITQRTRVEAADRRALLRKKEGKRLHVDLPPINRR